MHHFVMVCVYVCEGITMRVSLSVCVYEAISILIILLVWMSV